MSRCEQTGLKRTLTFFRTRSRSRLPSTRSSVAPSGRLTNGAGARDAWLKVSECSALHTGQYASDSPGAQLYGQPGTRWIGANSSRNPRAAVLFAVPLSPRINTPESDGLTAHSKSARFSLSWPTIAANGKIGFIKRRRSVSITHVIRRALRAALQYRDAIASARATSHRQAFSRGRVGPLRAGVRSSRRAPTDCWRSENAGYLG